MVLFSVHAELFKGWGLLLFVFFLMGFPKPSFSRLDTKARLLLAVEPENPKCFAEGMEDLTCFWEEEDGGSEDQYRFTYTYEYSNGNSNECTVSELPAGGSKKWYVCRLSEVQHFVCLQIQVFRDGQLVHNRSLQIDHVFLLDPPANVTLTRTGQQGQLRVSWQPPQLAYMKNSMMYEVSYAVTGSHMGKIATVKPGRELVLHGLQPGTNYDVRVRVKPDGISGRGYWSMWTPLVSMKTPPAELDWLVLALCVTISLIIVLLSLILLLSHRRFLLKKLWPVIPSPESKFQGLFTVCGGDFQKWIGFNDGDFRWRPAFLFTEDNPSILEVLSEARIGPLGPVPSAPSGASSLLTQVDFEEEEVSRRVGSRSMNRWREQPQQRWMLEQFQDAQRHSPLCPELSPLEPSDTYVSLNQSSLPEGHKSSPLDDMSEGSFPSQVLFTDLATPALDSDLGSLRDTTRSGGVSSQLSLEYPHCTWLLKGGGYVCMTATDSGISVDYSPMGSGTTAIASKDRIYANKYNFLPSRSAHPGQPIQSGC